MFALYWRGRDVCICFADGGGRITNNGVLKTIVARNLMYALFVVILQIKRTTKQMDFLTL